MSKVEDATRLQQADDFWLFVHFPTNVVIFCSAGKPVNSLFVSPAVTPIKSVLEPYSNNPAYRMYLYNTSDFSVLVRMEKKFVCLSEIQA